MAFHSHNQKKRAQAAMEYLAIIAIALVLLIPLVYLFHMYTSEYSNTIVQSRIKSIGEDLVNTAETVYYMGYPARLTIQEEFPSGIKGMNITSDWALSTNIISFYLWDGQELAYFCGVNINATVSPEDYSAGLKNIVLETRNSSQGNYVWIDIR